MNKYTLGDVVDSKDYDIEAGVIMTVEKVALNPKYNFRPKTMSEYLEAQDTYQYKIAYEFEGQVYEDTLYEHLID